MPKDAFWFPHDANARNDPDILDMRSKYKCEGYGWFWVLIEMMREQCDYRLSHSKASAYAMQCQCQPTKIIQFISDCVAFGLFESDGVCFWSNSLIRRMEGKDRRVEAGREAALKRWSRAKECEPNTNPLPTQSQPNAIRKEEKRREEIREEESTPKSDCSNEQSKRVRKSTTDPEAFTTFWNCYPRKVAKPVALKAWTKINPDDDLQKAIIHGLSRAKLSEQWQKDNGQFIPHPATWLNQRRWEDEHQPTIKAFETQREYELEHFSRMVSRVEDFSKDFDNL